jgi:hypothetical protein
MTFAEEYQNELAQIKTVTQRPQNLRDPLTTEQKKMAQKLYSRRQHARSQYAFNYIKRNLPELHEIIKKQVEKDIPL